MTNLSFIPKPEDEMKVTFGTVEKPVTIDLTFVPSAIGYKVAVMNKECLDNGYTPERMSEIIALFTEDNITAAWICENCDYGTLDQVTGAIIKRSLTRRAEKN